MQDEWALPLCISAGLCQPVIGVAALTSLHLNMNARVGGDDIRGVSSTGKLLASAGLAAHHRSPDFGRLQLTAAPLGTGLCHF
jgi:hypothetical protein